MSGIQNVEENANSSDLLLVNELQHAEEVGGFDFKTTIIGEFEYANPQE